MVQASPQPFRTFLSSDGINLADPFTAGLNPAYQSKRTLGASLIDLVNLSPTIHQNWSLMSVAVTGLLGFMMAPPSGYGKIGKVVMGLILPASGGVEPSPTDGGFSGLDRIPYEGGSTTVTNPRPLPADASLVADLWNPATDELPPIVLPTGGFSPPSSIGIPTTRLPISGQVTLPEARPVYPGTTIGIGLWMLPSLFGSAVAPVSPSQIGLALWRSAYTVTYDDGG